VADLVGPYTPDANTLFLFHFNEPAGGTATLNVGSKGGNAYSVDQNPASATAPTITTMLGAAGYVTNAINFGNCMTNPADLALQEGFCFGYDFNNSGAYQGEGTAPAPDALGMTNLNIGNGGQSAFTIEALIRPTTTAGNQEIIATDSSSANRGFQFRVTAGSLQFSFIFGGQAITRPIPTTGPHAFVSGEWYHVAVTYDGSTATLYWTKLDPSFGAANVLGTAGLTLNAGSGAVIGPVIIGNENRAAAGEQFLGSIDEVRISSVARAANQMQFFSPLVTITANPVSQNVDYNQPVTFSVSASSLTPLSYRWRYNSNSLPGLTSSAFTITNVAAGNAGYYDCVVTNTAGFAATSTPALLVVGAANFLANRYSFNVDTTDSVGGKDGTNFGTALVSGGALVLDGNVGTYMELPGGLYNATNATALTVEFWASFGVNGNWARVFDFGYTNQTGGNVVGANYFAFTPHNGSGGHQIAVNSASDPLFEQIIAAPGTFDGQTVHVACVFDPPSKSMSIYTNGVLEAVNTNMTVGIGSLNDQFSYIGRSQFPNDAYLNASIDEIRIFKGALSPITIKQSHDQGPNTLLADGPAEFVLQPTNTSIAVGQNATFTAAAVGYLPITYQWFKNGSLVPNATNASYSFATVIGDNGSTVQCWATNTIGVTTYVTSSSTATLSVFVPPTLAWLDFANGAASGDWDTFSPNWTNVAGGPITTFSASDAALFDSRGSGSPTVNLTQPLNPSKVTVNASTDYVLTSFGQNGSLTGQGSITKQNSGRLTIDVTNNMTGGMTISGGTVQIGNGGVSGTTGSGNITNHSTLAFYRSDAVTVANVIRGSGGVQVDAGTVTLAGANEYSGLTTINAGIVILPGATGLGSGSGGTVVNNGAQLYITGNQPVSGEALTLNGAGDVNGALRKGGAGLTTYGGMVTLASDSTIGVDGGATIALTNAPALAGSGVLTKNGPGTLALNSASTYSSTILDSGILAYNANGALGAGSVSTTPASTGRILLGDGTTLNNSVTADSVNPGAALGFIMVADNTNGTVTTVSGPLTFNADAVSGGHIVGPTTSGHLALTGPINLGGIATALSVRLGNTRFSGGGTYPEIQVRANTTSLGANNGIATTAVMDLAGNGSPTVPTYFNLNGFNQTLGGLKNTVGPANLGIVTNSGAAATLTLDLGVGGPFAFSGNIVGNLALRLNSGTQILTGTNSYTGNTTVSGGTLELVQPTLAPGSTVSIASGAVLQLDFTATNQISALVLNGVNQPAGVYSATTSPTFITGPGSLLVSAIATNPTNLTAVVNGNQYTLSWPASHKGWRLQGQTNSLSVGLNNNWATVPGSTATNQITVPINPAHGSVFFRLIYP
jgi:autotransporter-associated beta strand protein